MSSRSHREIREIRVSSLPLASEDQPEAGVRGEEVRRSRAAGLREGVKVRPSVDRRRGERLHSLALDTPALPAEDAVEFTSARSAAAGASTAEAE